MPLTPIIVLVIVPCSPRRLQILAEPISPSTRTSLQDPDSARPTFRREDQHRLHHVQERCLFRLIHHLHALLVSWLLHPHIVNHPSQSCLTESRRRFEAVTSNSPSSVKYSRPACQRAHQYTGSLPKKSVWPARLSSSVAAQGTNRSR